jgi:two-component system OmpR family sensor kinase
MTLRARLLMAMGFVAALLLVASFAVTRTTTGHLVAQVDEQLDRFVVTAGGGPRPGFDDPAAPPPREEDPGSGFSTLYVGAFVDGELVTRLAPNLGEQTAAAPLLDQAAAESLAQTQRFDSVGSSVPGTDFRVAASIDDTGALVVVGVPLDDVNAAVGRLVAVQAMTSVTVLLVLGLITWWVLRLGVRPLRQMTEAASDVAEGDLSLRLPDAPAGTEAAELGSALNTMLARLEQAFDERSRSEARLRRFIADASHELRTPVTTVRGYAELYRMGGLDDPRQLEAAMARTEAESVRMARLVEDLLALARLDRGAPARWQTVGLDAVVRDVVADMAVVRPERHIELDLVPVALDADADQLHQVVANLVTNAVVHTPAGAPVMVRLRDVDGAAVLRVEDRGPGMSALDRERAFERFHRADPSRSRASGGSGLGLSIVDAIVSAHGGSVHLEPTDLAGASTQGTTAVVELPGARVGVAP